MTEEDGDEQTGTIIDFTEDSPMFRVKLVSEIETIELLQKQLRC